VFALVFDGWSSHGTHFLTIFATWPDIQQASGYSQAILSFAPLSDEEHLDAQSNKDSMHGILQFYGKSFQMLLVLLAITVPQIAVLQRWQICSLLGVLAID
jgi:hypothetical protein